MQGRVVPQHLTPHTQHSTGPSPYQAFDASLGQPQQQVFHNGRIMGYDPMNQAQYEEQLRQQQYQQQHHQALQQQQQSAPPSGSGHYQGQGESHPQGQSNGSVPGRNKAAAQRALGVASQQQSQSQHEPQHQHQNQHQHQQSQMQQTRQMVVGPDGTAIHSLPGGSGGQMVLAQVINTINGPTHVLVDAQGRPVQLQGWQGAVQQIPSRILSNPQYAPNVQRFEQSQQMQQAMLMRQLQVQGQDHDQGWGEGRLDAERPTSQRGQTAVTPSPAPPSLQVPPPPSVQRQSIAAPSRSTSPMPPHLRLAPEATPHPMQMSISEPTNTATPLPHLPIRATTLPVESSTSDGFAHVDPVPSHSVIIPLSSAPDPAQEAATADRVFGNRQNSVRTAAQRNGRNAEKMAHLREFLGKVTIQIEDLLVGEEDHMEVAEEDLEEELPAEQRKALQRKFDDLLLDYLSRAGYATAVTALRNELTSSRPLPPTSTSPSASKHSVKSPTARNVVEETQEDGQSADMSMAESSGDISLEIVTPQNASPVKVASPIKSPSKLEQQSASESPKKPNIGPVVELPPTSPSDSLFGDGAFEAEEAQVNERPEGPTQNVKVEVAESPMLVDRQDSAKLSQPSQVDGPQVETNLGELFSWWLSHERRPRLKPVSPKSAPPIATASTVRPPDSAMAARIAISAPADAVRASSVAISALHATTTGADGPIQDPRGVTRYDSASLSVSARLQQAEEMRRAQQAQIEHQQRDQQHQQQQRSRGMMAAQVHQTSAQYTITDGQAVMTPDEAHHHMMVQMQAQEQQTHMGMRQQHMHMQQRPQYQPQQYQPFQQSQQGLYRTPTPNAIMGHMMPQYTGQGDISGSPSTDSGLSVKRGAGPSPIEGPGKRAKVVGKKPTPEDHQRQALQMASRVGYGISIPGLQHMPAGAVPSVNGIRNPQPNRPLTDAERSYAQRQAAYAQQYLSASPAAAMAQSFPGSSGPLPLPPPTAETPVNPNAIVPNQTPVSAKSKSRLKATPSLSLEIDPTGNNHGTDMPPSSAASRRKGSGKKGGKGTGGGGGKVKTHKVGRGRGSLSTTTPLQQHSQTQRQMPFWKRVADKVKSQGTGSAKAKGTTASSSSVIGAVDDMGMQTPSGPSSAIDGVNGFAEVETPNNPTDPASAMGFNQNPSTDETPLQSVGVGVGLGVHGKQQHQAVDLDVHGHGQAQAQAPMEHPFQADAQLLQFSQDANQLYQNQPQEQHLQHDLTFDHHLQQQQHTHHQLQDQQYMLDPQQQSDEDFLKNLGSLVQEGDLQLQPQTAQQQQQQPVSANGNSWLEDGFDFDWALADFNGNGGAEPDTGLLDTTET